jgi:hypothetical protein
MSLRNAKKAILCTYITVGFLLNEDDNVVRLTPCLNFDAIKADDDDECTGLFIIAKKLILERKELIEKEVL